jgi:hypothetical protein
MISSVACRAAMVGGACGVGYLAKRVNLGSPRKTWWAGQDSNLQPDRYERFDSDAMRYKSTV